MPEDSARRGVVITLQVLLAMLFLAIIGGVGGYVAGARVKQHRQPAAGPPIGASVTASPSSGERCLPHTEEQAGVSPLYQVLYLRTAQSEVWICKDAGGQLYYQGHKGQPGGDLIEGTTALFLTTVMREGADGYVAVNHDAVTGQTTEYHVNPRKLVQHFINYTPPKADRTELAIAP